VSYDIRLGRAALRAWVYPSLSEYMRQVLSEAGWEVLAGVLIWRTGVEGQHGSPRSWRQTSTVRTFHQLDGNGSP